MDRRSISQKRRTAMFLEQKGRCGECDCVLRPGHWEVDHVAALVHGGSNDDDNLTILCRNCHVAKSRRDVQARSKGDRVAVGGRQRKGPPMQGSRLSGLKKHMDGSVSRR